MEPEIKLSAILCAAGETGTLTIPVGATTDFAFATAKATSLKLLSHALGGVEIPLLGISQSSPPASIRITCNTRLAAVRIRAAIIG